MLDEFSSDRAADYIAGFPAHPHRGFETVTYMIEGHMRHEDHLGNRGELKSGGVQWMTAGRGIIHSEMPQQDHGRMHGFQLWVNLPAREKMKPASYRDISAEDIPTAALPAGRAKVIAGRLAVDGHSVEGPVTGLATDPLYFDIELTANATFSHPVDEDYNAFVYPYQGAVAVGPKGFQSDVETHSAAVLSQGTRIDVTAGPKGARFLLLAGRPLREPVVQYGPFVMNTREEIEQALRDYQRGKLAEPDNGKT
jgi:redox-sensitive bicupin YhaK (pirin superfamily)